MEAERPAFEVGFTFDCEAGCTRIIVQSAPLDNGWQNYTWAPTSEPSHTYESMAPVGMLHRWYDDRDKPRPTALIGK